MAVSKEYIVISIVVLLIVSVVATYSIHTTNRDVSRADISSKKSLNKIKEWKLIIPSDGYITIKRLCGINSTIAIPFIIKGQLDNSNLIIQVDDSLNALSIEGVDTTKNNVLSGFRFTPDESGIQILIDNMSALDTGDHYTYSGYIFLKQTSKLSATDNVIITFDIDGVSKSTHIKVKPDIGGEGIIIPLYVYPGSYWDKVIWIKKTHPPLDITIIANPNNGPGQSKDSTYDTYITRMQNNKVKVLGYVYTDYGNRNLTDVLNDVDKWVQWYHPDGIFLDEVTADGTNIAYYRTLISQIKTLYPNLLIVGNPGDFDPAWVTEYLDAGFDLLIIFEDNYYPNITRFDSLPNINSKFGILVYGVNELKCNAISLYSEKIGYIYVTNDVNPNPWDTLPPYINDEANCIVPPAKPLALDLMLALRANGSGSYTIAEHYPDYDLSSGDYNVTLSALLKNWTGGSVLLLGVTVDDNGNLVSARFEWVNGWNGTSLYACYNTDCVDTGVRDITTNWHNLTITISNSLVTMYVDGNSVGTFTPSGITHIKYVDVGSWDTTADYELYIDNVVEKKGTVIITEDFNDGIDEFFTTYVGDVEIVSK